MRIGEYLEKLLPLFGTPRRRQTVDVVLDGNPDAPLRKVAVCMTAAHRVLVQAVEEGCNLVITHEPLYWDHHNRIDTLLQDPVYLRKRDYLRENGLCVFHLHDHLHDARPDVIAAGMAKALAWEAYRKDESRTEFDFGGMRLGALVEHMGRTLGAGTIRYVGNPDLPVRNAVTSWGYAQRDACIGLIGRHEECVLIVGETLEWEFASYAMDMIASGEPKALIVAGHIPSEESGMRYCAELIAAGLPGIPLTFIPTGNPFRTAGP